MKEEKVKVNLRVGLLIRETLVDEAAVEDIRVGTLPIGCSSPRWIRS